MHTYRKTSNRSPRFLDHPVYVTIYYPVNHKNLHLTLERTVLSWELLILGTRCLTMLYQAQHQESRVDKAWKDQPMKYNYKEDLKLWICDCLDLDIEDTSILRPEVSMMMMMKVTVHNHSAQRWRSLYCGYIDGHWLGPAPVYLRLCQQVCW